MISYSDELLVIWREKLTCDLGCEISGALVQDILLTESVKHAEAYVLAAHFGHLNALLDEVPLSLAIGLFTADLVLDVLGLVDNLSAHL